jgi:serine/threonine protein kinase
MIPTASANRNILKSYRSLWSCLLCIPSCRTPHTGRGCFSSTSNRSSNRYTSLYNEIEEGTEGLEQYQSGGLPVIRIGDTLKQGQYTVVHKLGHGATSTVWLASCSAKSTFVAIKALTVTSSLQSHEAAMLQRFSSHSGIRRLLDKFDVVGPNGQHSYLVLEPALCSISTAKEASYFHPLRLPISRTIIADLVLTIRDLHSEGVVHGGKNERSPTYLLADQG